MNKQSKLFEHQSGFTLIESMITLIIMAFGMLSVAGLQISLTKNADLSKQRTEATRLAQEKIEFVRSFTGITSGNPSWNGLTGIVDQISPSSYKVGLSNGTNVDYTRTLTLGGTSADAHRSVLVTVGWIDRNNQNQLISLSSVISKSDPKDSGFLTFPLPQNTNLKRPKNRNLNIPVPAIILGDGKSALNLGINLTVVFSDVTGRVVQQCTGNVSADSYSRGGGNGATTGCTNINAVILAGFVSGFDLASGTLVVPGNPTNPIPNDLAIMPTGVNTSKLTGWDNTGGKTISCVYRVATDQNNGTEIPSSHYYLCIIPITTSGVGSAWSGTVSLGGVTTAIQTKVCRFEYNATLSSTSNSRNIQPYVSVSETLDNQNYFIQNSLDSQCPIVDSNARVVSGGGGTTGATVANGGLVQTRLHQDCRASTFTPLTLAAATTQNGSCPSTAFNTGAGL